MIQCSTIDKSGVGHTSSCVQVHCTDGGGLSVGADVQLRLQDVTLSQTAVQDLNQTSSIPQGHTECHFIFAIS